MDNIFTKEMSSDEARLAFFAAVDGKTAEEIEVLNSEYCKVLPEILKREFALSAEGWTIG